METVLSPTFRTSLALRSLAQAAFDVAAYDTVIHSSHVPGNPRCNLLSMMDASSGLAISANAGAGSSMHMAFMSRLPGKLGWPSLEACFGEWAGDTHRYGRGILLCGTGYKDANPLLENSR